MASAGKKGLVKVTGTTTAFSAEATTTSDSITYQITSATKRIWDPTYTITVKDGGSPTGEAYTINRLLGTVTFGGSAARTITLDGKYLPTSVAAEAKNWSLKASKVAADVTAFAAVNPAWKTYQAQMNGVAGTLSQWHTADTYFTDALTNDSLCVLELYDDSSANPLRVWAYVEANEISVALEKPQEASVSWTGCTDADGNSLGIVT